MLMVISLKETIHMESQMEKEDMNGQMEVITKVILKVVIEMAKGFSKTLMDQFTKVFMLVP